MALTYDPTTAPYWYESTVGEKYVATCSVTATTAESDSYTKKTPAGLDTTKPFMLSMTCSAAPDNSMPVDLWIGWDDSFALTGDTTAVAPVVAGTGGKFVRICDNAVAAVTPVVYTWEISPTLPVANVVAAANIALGLKVRVPSAPYYIFHQDGATLTAHTTYWKITQDRDAK